MRITAIMHQVNVAIEILISSYIQSIATSDFKNANNIVFSATENQSYRYYSRD